MSTYDDAVQRARIYTSAQAPCDMRTRKETTAYGTVTRSTHGSCEQLALGAVTGWLRLVHPTTPCCPGLCSPCHAPQASYRLVHASPSQTYGWLHSSPVTPRAIARRQR